MSLFPSARERTDEGFSLSAEQKRCVSEMCLLQLSIKDCVKKKIYLI